MPNGDSSKVRPIVFGPDKLNVALDSETDNGEIKPIVFSTTLLDSMEQAREYNKEEQLYKSPNVSISLQDNTLKPDLPGTIPFLSLKEQERFGRDIISGAIGTVSGMVGFLDYVSTLQGGAGTPTFLDDFGKSLNEISA